MTTEKTIALTRRTFVNKVLSLLFNMLSRLIIIFLTSLLGDIENEECFTCRGSEQYCHEPKIALK